MRRNLLLSVCLGICGLATSLANANSISVSASGVLTGNNNNNPVSATATFTFGSGTLTISLTDTTAITYDAVALVRNLQFDVTNGSTNLTSGALTSSSGVKRTVNGNGTFSDEAPASTNWGLTSGTDFLLSVGGSKELVINDPSGSTYSGNGSINGNPGHNPFLANSPSFTLSIPGATTSSTISDVVIGFGTGDLTLNGGPPVVPLPAASYGGLALLAAVGAVGWVRRARQC